MKRKSGLVFQKMWFGVSINFELHSEFQTNESGIIINISSVGNLPVLP